MKNIFIADVDDTIAPSIRPVAPAMAAEIGRVVREGGVFAFISGSTLAQISAQLTPFLDVPHHLLAVSGGHYARVSYAQGRARLEEVHCRVFSPEERVRVLAALEGLIARHGISPLTDRGDQLQDRGSQVTLSALGRNAPEGPKRAFDPDGRLREAWIVELVAELGAGFTIRRGGTSSIDVTPAGMDKAWGIRRFLRHNGLKPEEALFFGDNLQPGGNDSPALSVVDCLAVRDPQDTLGLLAHLPRHPERLAPRLLPAGGRFEGLGEA